jgi:ATP synthase protein I
MPAPLSHPPMRLLALIQGAATAGLSLVALVAADTVLAVSVLLGGVLSLVPTLWFASSVFRHSGARAVEAMIRSVYLGELVKLAMIGAGFGAVFALIEPLHVPALFGGFVLVHAAGLAATARHARASI